MMTLKVKLWPLIASLGLLWPACAAQPTGLVESRSFDRTLSTLLDTTAVQVIGVNELYTADQQKKVLLDTRTREEYEVSHIPGAIWIGYDSFEPSKVKNLDPTKEVIVYCSVGYRSEKIGQRLKNLGFKNVRNLYGSIFEWANQSYPLINSKGDTVKQIHAYNRIWGRWIENESLKKEY